MTFRSLIADLLLSGNLPNQYDITGLLTVGTAGGPRAELGVNSAGESGLRFYAADGVTELLNLDALTGDATLHNITITGSSTQDVVSLWYAGTPGAGTLRLSIAAGAGADPFGNNYPAGLALWDSAAVLVGNWNTAGLTLWNDNTGVQQGFIAIESQTGPNNISPVIFLNSGAGVAAGTGQAQIQIGSSGPAPDIEVLFLKGPAATTDPDLSSAYVTLQSGSSALADLGQGQLVFNDSPGGLQLCLNWGFFGAQMTGTVTAVQPGTTHPFVAESWHAVTGGIGWTGGWGDFGGSHQTVRYKIDANKRTWLDGDAKPGTWANGTVIMTLPVGYRPTAQRSNIRQTEGSAAGAYSLDVGSGGTVTLNDVVGAVPPIVDLSGISWPTD